KGRIIDSVADHLVFASVYIHLTLRCAFAGASPAIWLLALGAAISHALQGAAADYYRTAFLYFTGGARNGIDSSSALRSDYRKLSWGQRPWDKLLLPLLGQPVYYFWFELIPLNVLFVYLIARQEKMAESLEQLVVARHST